MAEDAVHKIFLRTENGVSVNIIVHLIHVQDGGAQGNLQKLRQGGGRDDGLQVRQVQIGGNAAELLKKIKNRVFQVLQGVILFLNEGLGKDILAEDGGLAVGGAEAGNADHGCALFDPQLGSNGRVRGIL